MAHVRALHPLGREPLVLEGERGEHVVDEPSHLPDPPARPGPDLRRTIKDDRDAVPLRPPGQPPVEPREIDEHTDIGPGVEKAPLRPPGEIDEPVDVEDHPQKPHHGQLREISDERAALGRHARPPEPDALNVGPPRTDRAHEQRRMMVARRLAGREEDAHEKLREARRPRRSISTSSDPP